jgi:hypothetical protein
MSENEPSEPQRIGFTPNPKNDIQEVLPTREPMTLEEVASEIEIKFKEPKKCPGCGIVLNRDFVGKCRADLIHKELVLVVSLASILKTLSVKGIPTSVSIMANQLVIRLGTGDAK